jgi:bifunctional non-homologous end joining protein LigD
VGLPVIEPSDLMHGVLARAPFSREGWIFEIKYDGYRAFVRKCEERVDLFSRHGTPLNSTFPDIIEAVEAVPGNFIWDAELTVDEQNGRPARLYVFDILAAGNDDLRGMPLNERKKILRETFDDTPVLVCPVGIETAGEWVFEQAIAHDLEGLMAKRLDSPYQAGRSRDWLKVKNSKYSRPAALGFGRRSSGH